MCNTLQSRVTVLCDVRKMSRSTLHCAEVSKTNSGIYSILVITLNERVVILVETVCSERYKNEQVFPYF